MRAEISPDPARIGAHPYEPSASNGSAGNAVANKDAKADTHSINPPVIGSMSSFSDQAVA